MKLIKPPLAFFNALTASRAPAKTPASPPQSSALSAAKFRKLSFSSPSNQETVAEVVFEEGEAPKQAQSIRRIGANWLVKIEKRTEPA